MEIQIVSVILVAALVLFITEKLPVELTSLGIIVVLMITGILDSREAIAGFSNPAVITVAALFCVSRAMVRTGVIGFIGQRIILYSKGNEKLILGMSLIVVAVSSAFLNNTPVVVLFTSILMGVCCEYGQSPSKFLIPVSYAAILAGTCTLIGTSTNILISDLSFENGYGALSMFELSVIGVPIAVLGMLIVYFASPRLMPSHKAPVCELKDGENTRYLAELRVPSESKLIGENPDTFFSDKYPSIELFEVVRHSNILVPGGQPLKASENDLMLVKGSANDLVAMLKDKLVELPHRAEGLDFKPYGEQPLIVELVIPPQSGLVGSKLLGQRRTLDPHIKIIAVKRRRVHYEEQILSNLTLKIGDILLVLCPADHLEVLRSSSDFIMVEDIHRQIIHKRKAPIAIAVFAGMIGAAALGVTSILVSAVVALFLLLLTGCIQMREAYDSIDAKVVLLIVGSLALGTAIQKTGAAHFYSEAFLSLFRTDNPRIILSAFIALASLSSHVLSNNATAVLLTPIGISTALALGVDPKPFIVAICFGASACYATPIGYQTNLLVYGPGGYRFTDYMKLGLPLSLMVWAMASFLVPLAWPF